MPGGFCKSALLILFFLLVSKALLFFSLNIVCEDMFSCSGAFFSSAGLSYHLLAGQSCKQLYVLQWNYIEPERVWRIVGSDEKGNLVLLLCRKVSTRWEVTHFLVLIITVPHGETVQDKDITWSKKWLSYQWYLCLLCRIPTWTLMPFGE